jgi:hypothetical protein
MRQNDWPAPDEERAKKIEKQTNEGLRGAVKISEKKTLEAKEAEKRPLGIPAICNFVLGNVGHILSNHWSE